MRSTLIDATSLPSLQDPTSHYNTFFLWFDFSISARNFLGTYLWKEECLRYWLMTMYRRVSLTKAARLEIIYFIRISNLRYVWRKLPYFLYVRVQLIASNKYIVPTTMEDFWVYFSWKFMSYAAVACVFWEILLLQVALEFIIISEGNSKKINVRFNLDCTDEWEHFYNESGKKNTLY